MTDNQRIAAKLDEIASIAKDVVYTLHEDRSTHANVVLDSLLPLRVALKELDELRRAHGTDGTQETQV
jgi:hypothetical protein